MSVSAADRLVQAERILSNLEARFAAAQDRQRELARRRREIAYGAESGTVAFAAQTLESLRDETVRNTMALEDLPHAISGAQTALAEAERAVVVERQKARGFLPTVAQLRAASESADAALKTFIDRMRELDAASVALVRADLGLPRHELVEVAARRGVAATLGAVGLASPVPSDARVSIVEAVGRLADLAEARLHRLSGEQVPEGLVEPGPEPEEEGLKLVDAEPEPAAGLTDRDFEEIATLASSRFNTTIDTARVVELWEAWGALSVEAPERSSRWIVKRLRLRNTPPHERPDGGY